MNVATEQFVICLVLPECLSATILSISDSLRLAKRVDTGLACFFLFCFSLGSFSGDKNSNPKEKLGISASVRSLVVMFCLTY